MAKDKFTDWKIRTAHAWFYIVPFCVYIGWLERYGLSLWKASFFIALLFILHWITDCRRWISSEDWLAKSIMVDQTLHIIQLAVLGSIFLT